MMTTREPGDLPVHTQFFLSSGGVSRRTVIDVSMRRRFGVVRIELPGTLFGTPSSYRGVCR